MPWPDSSDDRGTREPRGATGVRGGSPDPARTGGRVPATSGWWPYQATSTQFRHTLFRQIFAAAREVYPPWRGRRAVSADRKQRLVAVVVIGAALAGCASSPEGDLLPPERGEWRRAGAVTRYTADNLYDYIDGSAPFVISFGFQSLATADYRRASEPVTTVDLYDMGSADNAFALFRNKANLEAEPVEVGAEGAGSEARIEFWQGPYYVAVSNPSPEESEHVLALARDVAESLPPTEAWPAYLELLPETHRVPRSEKYLPDSFLGYEVLQRAASARYKCGDAEVTLFACRYDTPQAAAEALAAFKAQLEKKAPTKPLDCGDGGFVADTFILGPLAIFRRSHHLGGMIGYAKGAPADSLLADLDGRLAGR